MKNNFALNIGFHFCIWILFGFGVVFNTNISNLLQANSISQLKHDPILAFNYPYAKTVDWSKNLELTNSKYSEINSSALRDTVKYNPSLLGNLDNLASLTPEQINTRMTYSVPYMGNYEYDGKEYAGSHPGVDIKLPYGTPILSIANGVVTKVKYSEVGFGNHVVIKHNNVQVNESGMNESIYSSYAHLSEITVKAGDVVSAGAVIGKTGNSGLSTGSHLNFQIEKDTAKWHPYWPFSDTEIFKAGLNFVSGINSGFGFEDAIKHTLNPLVFIDMFNSRYNSTTMLAESQTQTSADKSVENNEVKTNVETALEIALKPVQEYFIASLSNDIVDNAILDTATQMPEIISSQPKQQVLAADGSVESEINFVADNLEIQIPSLMKVGGSYEFEILSSKINLSESTIKVMFSKSVEVKDVMIEPGVITYTIRPLSVGTTSLELWIDDYLTQPVSFDVVNFGDLNQDHPYYQEVKLLSTLGFVNGNKNHEVNLEQEITAAEAIKLLVLLLEYQGYQKDTKYSLSNFSSNDWFNDYVDQALAFGIIDNQTLFHGDQSVSIDEFLAWYYQGSKDYVNPNIKRLFARYVRKFGKNKLFVQQALIDNIVDTQKVSTSNMKRSDLFVIIYNILVNKSTLQE